MHYKIDVINKWQYLEALALCVCLTGCANSTNFTNSFTHPAQPANGNMTLTVPVLDSQVVLKTSAEFSGAISSLVFRGKEHIDSNDTGRLFQSAVSFNNYGECFNPTEGGSGGDRANPRGRLRTSNLKEAYIGKNQLWTLTDMAFWLYPGRPYPVGCGLHKELTQAINTKVTAGYLLEKKITVGLPNFPNVIERKVSFRVPENFAFGLFVAAVGYMPEDFSLMLLFNPINGEERIADDSHRERPVPIIFATPDRKYAMGVYSKQLPQPGYPRAGYGHTTFPFAHVNSWNCVFREKNVTPKAYQYTCLVILGTVDEVEETMRRLVKANM